VIDEPKPCITGLKEPDVTAHDELRFDSVTFAYPSRPHVKVLDELTVGFESGKITAIVGASGSGKSTIVGLLERWYELNKNRMAQPDSLMNENATQAKPDSESKSELEEGLPIPDHVEIGGSVLVGEHNLDTTDLKWWRSQIGLVQQEPFIFNDTIAKNVEYGLIGSQWENEDAQTKKGLVQQACKEAFADEYISKLPMVSDPNLALI
jgi:ATP-binding cassette subfamily B (MDR/TAP) protein 1